jgi:hypothetical protein
MKRGQGFTLYTKGTDLAQPLLITITIRTTASDCFRTTMLPSWCES